MPGSEQAKRASKALIIVGCVSVANGFFANFFLAEKSYNVQSYRNTHWITAISLFAGISAKLCRSFSVITHLFVLMLATNLFAFIVSSTALIADFANILALIADFSAIKSNLITSQSRVYWMLSYSVVDFLLCGLSLILIFAILSACFRSFFETTVEARSKVLLLFGVILASLSLAKFLLWIFELYWLKTLGNLTRFTFIHYTIDEPIWVILCCTVGALCIMSSQGGTVLRMVTLCLSSICIHSTIIYLWIDYRWFSNAVVSRLTPSSASPTPMLIANLITGSLTSTSLIAISVYLISSLSKPLNFKLSAKLSSFFFCTGCVALGLSLLLFGFDVLTARFESFYRVFQGTEQKTPFLVFVVAVFLLLLSKRSVDYFVLPAALTAILLCTQSSTFLLFSYLYLSWNNYFSTDFCEMFYYGAARCARQSVSKVGAVAHFFEAFAYCFILLSSVALSLILHRLSSLYASRPTRLSRTQQRRSSRYQHIIEISGFGLLLMGLIVFGATVVEFAGSKARHPLIILLSSLYHVSLGISLVIFPLYQVVVSRFLLINPLSCVTLIMMNTMRFAEILSQLDYRNIGETASLSWRLHNGVEIFALGIQFMTVVLCIKIFEISSGSCLPEIPPSFSEFRNPLSTELPRLYLRVPQNSYDMQPNF